MKNSENWRRIIVAKMLNKLITIYSWTLTSHIYNNWRELNDYE